MIPDRTGKKNANSTASLLGDEQAAELRHDVAALQRRFDELAQQVHSQYTTIAAHAEIARQQADFVRVEARADLDRTRETLIGLLEAVRHEAGFGGAAAAPVDEERFSKVEEQVAAAAESVENCIRRQNELANTMEALLDTVVFSRADCPVVRL